MKQLTEQRKEDEDDSGILYDLHEKMREVFTLYNDTVEGRCAVCLEQFVNEGEQEGQCFTDRVDLVRIDQCYHRFHMICVHRDWFMPRQSYKDSYGDVTKYEIPEEKRCPICRREVDEQEVKYVSEQKSAHPEIDDGGYTL